MVNIKLTKQVIAEAEARPNRYILRDTLAPGFGCRIFPSGHKSFIVEYFLRGKKRRPVIGTVGAMPVDDARDKAIRWLVQVRNGIDPLDEQIAERRKLTVKAFADRFISEHCEIKNKPRTVDSNRTNLRLHILPVIGNIRIDQVTRSDVQRLHSRMYKTPGAANRCLSLLSKMFNLAEKWEVRPDGSNPCRHVEKFRERKIERYLTPVEFRMLAKVLIDGEADGSIDINVIRALRLLIFTGCRVNEILTVQWKFLDPANKRLILPDSKTGRKIIYLSNAAIDVFRSIPFNPDNTYVLPGRYGRGHMGRMGHQWLEIRQRAGIPDVRMHDLRHSFASVAAGIGESLPMIGNLLGHTQAQTTARYAHLASQPLIAAADRIGRELAHSMKALDPLQIGFDHPFDQDGDASPPPTPCNGGDQNVMSTDAFISESATEPNLHSRSEVDNWPDQREEYKSGVLTASVSTLTLYKQKLRLSSP